MNTEDAISREEWTSLKKEWFGCKYAAMQPAEAVRARCSDDADRINALERENARMLGWIAVSDRLPEMGEAVFLIDPNYGKFVGSRGWGEDGWLWGTSSGAVWHNGQRWDCDCHQDADYQPTLWHALPALPNVKDERPRRA